MTLSALVAMSLSGPGDSTSRSRSLTSSPPPRFAGVPSAVLGGSGQLRAMRSCPFSMYRCPPNIVVFTPSTTNDFVTTAVHSSILVQSVLTVHLRSLSLLQTIQSAFVVQLFVASLLHV